MADKVVQPSHVGGKKVDASPLDDKPQMKKTTKAKNSNGGTTKATSTKKKVGFKEQPAAAIQKKASTEKDGEEWESVPSKKKTVDTTSTTTTQELVAVLTQPSNGTGADDGQQKVTRLQSEIAMLGNVFFPLEMDTSMTPPFAASIRVKMKVKGVSIVQIATVHIFLSLLGKKFPVPSVVEFDAKEHDAAGNVVDTSFLAKWGTTEVRIGHQTAHVIRTGGIRKTFGLELDGPNEFHKYLKSAVC